MTLQFMDLRQLAATPSAHLLLGLAEALPARRQAELTAATGLATASEALVALTMVSGLGWIVTADGQAIAAFGCTPQSGDTAGGFWLLETEAAERQPPIYFRRILRRLTETQTVHPILTTTAPTDDSRARRRLRLLGFTPAGARSDPNAPFPTCQYRRIA